MCDNDGERKENKQKIESPWSPCTTRLGYSAPILSIRSPICVYIKCALNVFCELNLLTVYLIMYIMCSVYKCVL